MDKSFEDTLSEWESELVDVCAEFAEGRAEKVFLYGAFESVVVFDVFYQVAGKTLRKDELGKADGDMEFQHGANREIIGDLINIGIEALEELELICRECEMQMPTEIKLAYDAASGEVKGEYSYRPVTGVAGAPSPEEVFERWFVSVKEKVA